MSHFLLQTEGGSGFGEFIGQIQGLLVVTVIAGIIWLGLTYLILRRDAERRHRKREGLPPLPSFYKQAFDYFQARQNQATPVQKIESTPSDFALPDLDALTADLPAPNLDMLTDDFPMSNPIVEEVEEAFIPPAPTYVAAAIEQEAILEPVVAESFSYVAGSNELPGDAVEMMRVWRDVSDGRLIIGMKDQLFASLGEIQDAALRSRFQKLVQDLNQLTNTPRPMPKVPEPVKQTSTAAQAFGMADQIEMLLQTKLLQSPSLIGRNIHVHSGTSGGVMIEVDGQFYDAVSDVSDSEVRRFLQETIQEWEARS